VRAGLRRAKEEGKIAAEIEAAIQAALRRKDRPGVRVIAVTQGVNESTRCSASHTRNDQFTRRSDPPAHLLRRPAERDSAALLGAPTEELFFTARASRCVVGQVPVL
jgi:hypothetical protein